MRYGLMVCPLAGVAAALRREPVTHLISLAEPDGGLPTPPEVSPERHLRVPMADEERADRAGAPTEEDARRILAFGRTVPDGGLVLVHCEAGVSRSGAAALALIAQALGPGRLGGAVGLLRAVRPEAHPNALLTAHADRLLGLGGALEALLPEIRAHADDLYASRLGGAP